MQKKTSGISAVILLFIVVAFLSTFLFNQEPQEKKLYVDLINEIKNDQVVKLEIQDNTALATYKDKDKNGEAKTYAFTIPSVELLREQVTPEKFDAMQVDIIPPPSIPWYLSILTPVVFLLIIVLFWVFFMKQQGGGGGKVMSFGKSKAKVMTDDAKKVTFADVAGVDEEKEELTEIVDFLKAPKKFVELGARIPKGVLLIGPPGTGKTLLAKAVAGEAGVPFFSISGSDFVEMFVGVGASRVRDLFDQAKKNQPAIIFIDEIDAVGRHRGAGMGGGHDEREQTLNQLLVEMDGFGVNEGVIVIAATNRADILDPALLRPGRFDRQVYVGYPDQKGRAAILSVHAKNKPIGNDVDLETVAKTTYGFTGADLENLLNEGALLAARKDKKQINMPELDEAMLKVVMGPEKKNRVVSQKSKKMTAYHEAGHAIASALLPTQDPVHQVSIIPRGKAGGFTMSLPTADKDYVSKQEMIENIIVMMAGRVSEELIFGEINTGASSDIKRATEVATKMVTEYGMSEKLGSMTFGSNDNEIFIGRDYGQAKTYSEETAAEIDKEVSKFIHLGYEKCKELILANQDKLEAVAQALIEKEKLDGAEFAAIMGIDVATETAEEGRVRDGQPQD